MNNTSQQNIPYIVMTSDGPLYPPTEFPWSGSWMSDMTQGPNKNDRAKGQLLYLFGKILDDKGLPISGATVEIWQADAKGNYKHPRAKNQDSLDPHFLYFSRVKTNKDGTYLFKTIVPSYYEFSGAVRAPHIHIKMRSLNHGVFTTQMYFEGDEDDLMRQKDRVFQGHRKENRGRMIIPKEAPERYNDLGIEIEKDAVCCRYDLAFFF